jgi:hypothetical protein
MRTPIADTKTARTMSTRTIQTPRRTAILQVYDKVVYRGRAEGQAVA